MTSTDFSLSTGDMTIRFANWPSLQLLSIAGPAAADPIKIGVAGPSPVGRPPGREDA
jgi:hypothetical protein